MRNDLPGGDIPGLGRGKLVIDCMPTLRLCDLVWEIGINQASWRLSEDARERRYPTIERLEDGTTRHLGSFRIGEVLVDPTNFRFPLTVLQRLNTEILLKLVSLRETGEFPRSHSPRQIWSGIPQLAQERLRDLLVQLETQCHYGPAGRGSLDAYLDDDSFVSSRYTWLTTAAEFAELEREVEQRRNTETSAPPSEKKPTLSVQGLGLISHLLATDLGGMSHPAECFRAHESGLPDFLVQ